MDGNQLSRLTTIVRSGADDDRESYEYDTSGQRVRKTGFRQTSGSQVCQQTIYLPGLERHTTNSGSQTQEELDVILIGQAGRSQVRVLCWQTGRPANRMLFQINKCGTAWMIYLALAS